MRIKNSDWLIFFYLAKAHAIFKIFYESNFILRHNNIISRQQNNIFDNNIKMRYFLRKGLLFLCFILFYYLCVYTLM